VLENGAGKDVTTLRDFWVMKGEDGKQRKHTVSPDRYMVGVCQPVLGAGDRKLICLSATVDESLIEHVLRGHFTCYLNRTYHVLTTWTNNLVVSI
jgi:hypothetical protein